MIVVLMELIGMDIIVKLVIMHVVMNTYGTLRKIDVFLKNSVEFINFGMEFIVDVSKEPSGLNKNAKNVNMEHILMD